MTPLDLDALRALADAATPGPWLFEGESYEWEMWTEPLDPDGFYVHIAEGDPDYPPLTVADGRFIAAARTAVPALIAEVERLRDRLRLADIDGVNLLTERLRAEADGDAARAEVARLRAVVASVKALCDEAESGEPVGWVWTQKVRAALAAAPTPTEEDR